MYDQYRYFFLQGFQSSALHMKECLYVVAPLIFLTVRNALNPFLTLRVNIAWRQMIKEATKRTVKLMVRVNES